MNKRLRLLLPLYLVSLRLFSQDADFFQPDSIKKEITALKISSFIHIDGIMNEPEWKLAKSSPRFIQIEPYQGKNPNYETEIKVMYNREYLYVGVFARDSLG